MAAEYPAAVPTLVNPTSTSTMESPSHSDQHIDANNEIVAICTELGTDVAGTKTDLKTYLAVQHSTDGTHVALTSVSCVVTGTGTGTITTLQNNGTGTGVYINQNAINAASKYGLHVYTDEVQVNSPLVYFQQQGASDQTVLKVLNKGTGIAVHIDQDALAPCLQLDSALHGAHIRMIGDPTVASPTDGELWFTGSALNFRNGTATINLLTTTYDPSAVTITGGSLSNVSIGSGTANTAAFITMDVTNSTTADGVEITQVAVSTVGEYALYVHSTSAQVNASLVRLDMTNAASTQTVLDVANSGKGGGILLTQTGTGGTGDAFKVYCNVALTTGGIAVFDANHASITTDVVNIENAGTGSSLLVEHAGASAANKNAVRVLSSVAQASSNAVFIQSSHADTTKAAVAIDVDTNDASDPALGLEINVDNAGVGNQIAIDIDQVDEAKSYVARLNATTAWTSTAAPGTDAVVGWLKVMVGTAAQYIPYYNA